MRNFWPALPALAILSLTGCVDFAEFGDSERYKEDFHYSYPLTAGGTVSIENSNGSVEISGWDQNTVEINGTKYGATKSLLDAVKVETNANAGSVHIRTIRPVEGSHGNSGAKYLIRVPRKALLDSIATTNGSIRLQDLDGNARLRSTNGSIRVHKVHGEVEARTTNGSIETEGLDGNGNLHTSNGSIRSDSSRGSFDATTTNGSITATLTDPPVSAPVKAHSTNGRIELRIKGAKVPDVRAETTNSGITLRLPGDVNARVRANTTHASISSDFDLGASSQHSRSELEGTIGSGGPVIELSSRNGSIKILKL